MSASILLTTTASPACIERPGKHFRENPKSGSSAMVAGADMQVIETRRHLVVSESSWLQDRRVELAYLPAPSTGLCHDDLRPHPGLTLASNHTVMASNGLLWNRPDRKSCNGFPEQSAGHRSALRGFLNRVSQVRFLPRARCDVAGQRRFFRAVTRSRDTTVEAPGLTEASAA